MESRRFPGALVTVLAALLLPGGARPAQEGSPSSSFEEELSVEVINVEVYVTDKKGRPVTGLTREDFRLFEDGKPVEIEYFSAFEGAGPDAAAAPAPPEDDRGPAPEAPAAVREPRSLVIYLDDAHTSVSGRRRVLADLREMVATGRDGADRLMLVAHEPGLRLVQPFTSDRQEILAALDALAKRAVSGYFRPRERAAAYDAIRTNYRGAEGNCSSMWAVLEAVARQHADRVAGDVNGAMGALSQIVSALSGVTGRKSLLYVADGLEQRPGIDLFYYIGELCPSYQHEYTKNYLSYDQIQVFQRLTAHANANGVTLYTLEALGLQTDVDAGEAMDLRPSIMVKRLAAANLQSPLFHLANETGGRAVLNANVFDEELDRIAGDFATYYSLGFESGHRGDGRLHRLKVEVEGRGHRVRHRTYYRDKELETRFAELVWGTLLLGTTSNPLGVEVGAGEARGAGRGCCTVPVQIRLPLDGLSLVPGAESSSGRVYVVMTALRADGEVIPVRGREIPIEAAGGDAPAFGSRTLIVDVDLAPGTYDLAVGLVDLLGGGESYVRRSLEVAPPSAEATAAVPPP